jgi:hypothetical protein
MKTELRIKYVNPTYTVMAFDQEGNQLAKYSSFVLDDAIEELQKQLVNFAKDEEG